MASKREIVGLETIIGAYGCELIDDTTEYIPPTGLAIASIIPTEDTVINTVDQLVRYGGFRNAGDDITSIADYSGTVAGTILITSTNAHGLISGTRVTIDGTTNYDGTYTVTVVSGTTFYVTATFVADEVPSTWSAIVDSTTEEVTAKNWLDTSVPQGTQIFPNWNNPITSITLTSGAVMVYFIKI